MESLWEQTWEQPDFPSQHGDMSTDVLIIGGGMAGILCAYQLHCAGVPYVLVEAETLCSGITKNTTAKITSQHGLIYDKLISKFGVQRAKQYLAANQAAVQTYRELCRNMDCDFEEKAAYVYALDDRRKIERELNALDINQRFTGTNVGLVPFRKFGCDLKSFQAHPDDLLCRFAVYIHSSSSPCILHYISYPTLLPKICSTQNLTFLILRLIITHVIEHPL